MAGGDWQDQLKEVQSFVRKESPAPKVAESDLEHGEILIDTGTGSKQRVVLCPEDRQIFVENQKKLQTAMIWERRFAATANVGMALLAIITAAGAGVALVRGATGTTNMTN
jgi:hypothetical protein